MMDLLLKNVCLPLREGRFTVALADGKIASIDPTLDTVARREVDCGGRLLSTGFVDAHMHLEKSCIDTEEEAFGLLDAIRISRDAFARFTKEDIKRRARKTAEMAIRSGTTTLRTHTVVNPILGLMAVEAMAEVQEEFSKRLEIQQVAMLSLTDPDEQRAALTALEHLPVTAYGGAPHVLDCPETLIQQVFEVAKAHGRAVDFHVDEVDKPALPTLKTILTYTRKYGMEGNVTAGHLCGLAFVSKVEADVAISALHDTGIHVVTLPSCNLYLMCRTEEEPRRRGITRVSELLAAGVNVSYASDNVRDPFRPYGNADMLEEGMLTAQVAQMAARSQLETIYHMGTDHPAKALGLKDYGLEPGCRADVVLLDAPTVQEALIARAQRLLVLKNGRVVHAAGAYTELLGEER